MPDYDPREVLTPDEAENRVFREALESILLATQSTARSEEIVTRVRYLAEDALLEGDVERCLAERSRDE